MKRIQAIGVTLLGLLVAVALWLLPLSRYIDGFIYDLSLRFGGVDARETRVVVVGIDDASLDDNRLPLVMWHDQLASVIGGISDGGATRLGLSLVPAVSMEGLAPELDRKLMRAIRGASQQGAEVILGFSVGKNGVMPERKFIFAASGLGFLNLFPDPDGVIRRQVLSVRDERGRLAHSIAMLLAKPDALDPEDDLAYTFINYRQPPPVTVSFLEVLQLAEKGDQAALRAIFKDKLVLIGTSTRKFYDVHKVPRIPGLSGDGSLTGAHILALMVGALESDTVIYPLRGQYSLSLLGALALISSLLFLYRPPLRALLLVTAIAAIMLYCSYLVLLAGHVVPASAILYGVIIPAAIGLLYRLNHEYQLKTTLNRFFRSYVNLDRLEHIMANPRERFKQERELKEGIEKRQQFLQYQPKVEVASGLIVGMEALVRWIKPGGEIVRPDLFISLAEETGLINELTELIIEQASAFAVILARTDYGEHGQTPKISINLSARDLERADLLDFFAGVLAKRNLDPGRVDLEITESSLIQGFDEAIEKISALRAMGFTVSIDDFGSGYSSLGYIKNIPFDYLKIDKSLVDDIATDQRSLAVIRSIVAMARGLGARVIAEGVEDHEQVAQLRRLGCDQIQGYVFSKPLAKKEILGIIKSGKRFASEPVATAER